MYLISREIPWLYTKGRRNLGCLLCFSITTPGELGIMWDPNPVESVKLVGVVHYMCVCVCVRKIQHPVLATFMSASLFRGSQEYVVIKSDLLCLFIGVFYKLNWCNWIVRVGLIRTHSQRCQCDDYKCFMLVT